MSDLDNLVWIDITSDFDPLAYAGAFAEDDVCEQLDGLDTPEEQLICLYENGYLSKRGGRIQYLLPEEALEEKESIYAQAQASKPTSGEMHGPKRSRVRSAIRTGRDVAGAARSRLGSLHTAGKEASEFGKGIVSKGTTARQYAGGVLKAMSGKEKVAAGLGAAGLAAGGLLAARALAKRRKARKAAKMAKRESQEWTEADLEFLLDEAELLGFEFETYEELVEALEIGDEVDALMTVAEEEGLMEDFSEEEVLEAFLDEDGDELDEEEKGLWDRFKGWASKTGLGQAHAAGKAAVPGAAPAGGMGPVQKFGKMRSAGRYVKGVWDSGKTGKAALIGTSLAGAAAVGMGLKALARRAKRRKAAKMAQRESLDMDDLDAIIEDSRELGFEFETYEELVEALQVGDILDELVADYVEDDDLAENLLPEDELEVMACVLSELDEDGIEAIASMPYSATEAPQTDEACSMKHKPKKKKAMKESTEFCGYRSSAQGSIYESAPVPFGTGNNLYERISKNLLTTAFGQEIVNKVDG